MHSESKMCCKVYFKNLKLLNKNAVFYKTKIAKIDKFQNIKYL